MTRAFAASTFSLITLTAALPALADAPASSDTAMRLSVPAPAPSAESSVDSGPPLLFGRNLEVRGYRGLDLMYTRMFGRDGTVVRLQGPGSSIIPSRSAFPGYGFPNSPFGAWTPSKGSPQYFETGYGGLPRGFFLKNQKPPVLLTPRPSGRGGDL